MRMKHVLWTCGAGALGVGLVAMMVSAQPKAEPAKPSPRPFKPVLEVHQLMEGQGMLFANIKAAIQDREWNAAYRNAWILAEIANVNQHQKSESDYTGFAGKMSAQCSELANTLRKRDLEGAKNQVTLISQTCKSCHDKYKHD